MSTLDTITCDHLPKIARDMCRRCYRRWHARVWRSNNKDRANETARKWRQRHPQAQRAWDRKHKLIRSYGITLEEYQNLLSTQDGKCAMEGCSRDANVIDHDHKTGKVRGLLCSQHNCGLGQFQDNVDQLMDAIEYLRKVK